MSQKSDILIDNVSTISDFLHIYPSRLSQATAISYTKAIRSFIAFAGNELREGNCITDILIGDWVIDMVLSGLTPKTASYYLDCMCSVYNVAVEEGFASPSQSFQKIKSLLKSLLNSDKSIKATCSSLSSFNLDALSSMIRTADQQKGELRLFTDISILSLLNPRLSLEEITRLKKRDLDTLSAASQPIAERHIDSRRSYLFPLGQNEKTPKQIVTRCNEKIIALLKFRGLPTSTDAQDSLRSLWLHTALKAGFRASAAVSVIGNVPKGLPILSIASKISISDENRNDISNTIAKILVENPRQWHVMRLRHGVKFKSFKKRLELLKDDINASDTFYPCEEIARKIGKKVIYKDKPLIPGIVFLRTRSSDINMIMRTAGDIAWCMRDTSRADRRYAIVSQHSMEIFQQIIGQFTPDYQLYPLGTLLLKPQDRVIIIGGDYSGTEAVVEKSPKETTGDIIYQIRFIDDTGFEWHIPKDQRLLKKIE